MGDKLRRVSAVTAGFLVTALAGTLTTSALPTAAAVRAPAVSAQAISAAAQTNTRRFATFHAASFNVLGWSHTRNGENGRIGGVKRMVFARQLLINHHVDVAGFQELQRPQLRKLTELTGGRWAFYPGLTLGALNSENSVGWRTSRFTLVQATTVRIPYFNGRPRIMPIVLLRHRASGMLVYVANFHNPAETAQFKNQGRWRKAASRVEIALQNQLVARGIPRIMTGDMNERGPYFCRVTRNGTPLHAARPGSTRDSGVCHPGRPPFVDWIFGSLRAEFSDYTEDNGDLDKQTSDHPVVVSRVRVDRRVMPKGWGSVPPPVVPRLTY